MQKRVVILGLGKIALGYDLDAPIGRVYSHAKAFQTHPGFELISGIDPSVDARSRFEAFTGKKAYPNVSEFLDVSGAPSPIDVCVVATPTPAHLDSVREAIALKPKFILLEKPIANTEAEEEEIRRLLKAAQIPCHVNFIRQYDPGLSALRDQVRAGHFGMFQSGVCHYNRGLLNNGTHYIELLNSMLGQVRLGALLESPYADPNFVLNYAGKPLAFLATDVQWYDVGEIDLYFTDGRIRISQFGEQIECWKRERDPEVAGYFRLLSGSPPEQPRMKEYQLHVASRIHDHLIRGTELPCALEATLPTFALCHEILGRKS